MSVQGFQFRRGDHGARQRDRGFRARSEIELREDAHRAAKAKRAAVKAPELDRELASKRESEAARQWVQRVGFEPRVQGYAISAAIELRKQLGAGAVTKQLVMERMRAKWPFLFEQSTEAA